MHLGLLFITILLGYHIGNDLVRNLDDIVPILWLGTPCQKVRDVMSSHDHINMDFLSRPGNL